MRVVTAAVVLVALFMMSSAAEADTGSVTSHADWILIAQLPDGAIAHHVDRVAVWPYLANFAAMGLTRATAVTGDPRYVAATWRWLEWYQGHMDGDGFVTDYAISGGAVVSTGDMDSTDAYAGTFLLAARHAWLVTGDRARLRSLRHGVTKAVGAIEATQDGDGLTWAKPSWRVKYLMDQGEAYAGLRAGADIAGVLGDATLASRATSAADRMYRGVAALWNPATGAYDWAVHEDGTRVPTDWTALDPDALQQLWAVAFGLVDPSRATGLLARFETAHPAWDQPQALDRIDGGSRPVGYWAVVGWAYLRVGDTARAAMAAASLEAAALAAGRAWPFTPSDAGQLIVLTSGGLHHLPGAAATPRKERSGGPKRRG